MIIATAEINLTAIQHNINVVRKLAPTSKVMAMIKANAYGHGYVEVAKALIKADAFGVARLEEAKTLRNAGIDKAIVLLEGWFEKSELEDVANLQLDTVIHCKQQVIEFISTRLTQPVTVWLKLDSGMNRIGLSPAEFSECYDLLNNHANVKGELKLMTHMACADEINHPQNAEQIQLFNQITNSLVGDKSIANSATIMSNNDAHCDWVRPGIMMYGASALVESLGSDFNLQPAMTLKSSVIAVRKVKAGDSVGYGMTWVAKQDCSIAVIAIGYGDGYPRNAQSGTPVLINDTEYPLAGRVSMDMITVDVGVQSDIKIGDEVILWGQGLPIERIARHSSSISYELLCGITTRVKKQFLK